jgi:hypothetical protein
MHGNFMGYIEDINKIVQDDSKKAKEKFDELAAKYKEENDNRYEKNFHISYLDAMAKQIKDMLEDKRLSEPQKGKLNTLKDSIHEKIESIKKDKEGPLANKYFLQEEIKEAQSIMADIDKKDLEESLVSTAESAPKPAEAKTLTKQGDNFGELSDYILMLKDDDLEKILALLKSEELPEVFTAKLKELKVPEDKAVLISENQEEILSFINKKLNTHALAAETTEEELGISREVSPAGSRRSSTSSESEEFFSVQEPELLNKDKQSPKQLSDKPYKGRDLVIHNLLLAANMSPKAIADVMSDKSSKYYKGAAKLADNFLMQSGFDVNKNTPMKGTRPFRKVDEEKLDDLITKHIEGLSSDTLTNHLKESAKYLLGQAMLYGNSAFFDWAKSVAKNDFNKLNAEQKKELISEWAKKGTNDKLLAEALKAECPSRWNMVSKAVVGAVNSLASYRNLAIGYVAAAMLFPPAAPVILTIALFKAAIDVGEGMAKAAKFTLDTIQQLRHGLCFAADNLVRGICEIPRLLVNTVSLAVQSVGAITCALELPFKCAFFPINTIGQSLKEGSITKGLAYAQEKFVEFRGSKIISFGKDISVDDRYNKFFPEGREFSFSIFDKLSGAKAHREKIAVGEERLNHVIFHKDLSPEKSATISKDREEKKELSPKSLLEKSREQDKGKQGENTKDRTELSEEVKKEALSILPKETPVELSDSKTVGQIGQKTPDNTPKAKGGSVLGELVSSGGGSGGSGSNILTTIVNEIFR